MPTTALLQSRHSVRKYDPRPLAPDVLTALSQKVDAINAATGLHIQLITNEPKAFSGIITYGQFSGVTNYFVMAGPKSDDLDEIVGYYGEQLVLLSQELGLNTCWAGVTYSKIPGTYQLEENEKIACYIAVGYGLTQGNGHKVKSPEEVSNASDLTPAWFRAGVEAALLAPTAVNQQKFYIEYLGMKGGGKHKVSIRKFFSMIGYAQMDMGIAKLHFEIGAGKDNFEWV